MTESGIELQPRKTTVTLALTIAALVCAHLIGSLYFYFNQTSEIPWLIQFVHFGHEQNLPTYYSSLTILFCAILFYVISQASKKSRDYYYWLILSGIFLFLSIDEGTSVHEQLHTLIQRRTDLSGLLYFAWVIPYGLAVALLTIFYAAFVFRLPRKPRFLLIASGVLYIGGAIGFEMIGGYVFETSGSRSVLFQFFTLTEETLEMLGVLVLIYALTSYIAEELNGLKRGICIIKPNAAKPS